MIKVHWFYKQKHCFHSLKTLLKQGPAPPLLQKSFETMKTMIFLIKPVYFKLFLYLFYICYTF